MDGDRIKPYMLTEKYKAQSKEILCKMCTTRIRTAMIGSLDAIEKGLGSRMENDLELQSLYSEIRKEILDKGNGQIRELEDELKNFDVRWLKYHISFKVRKGGNES